MPTPRPARTPACLHVLLPPLICCLLLPAVASAQGALTNGGNHSGSISTPGEIDEWTFTASINSSIILSIGEVPPGQPDPNFQPWIRLRRPDGVEIGSAAGVVAASINVTAPLSGTYTVLVRDFTGNRPGTALGSYILHFVSVPGDFVIPAGDDGGPLTNGGSNAGRIGAPGAAPQLQPGDVDVWTFDAAQNDAIGVSIGEVLTSEVDPNFQPWIRLFGPNGAFITQAAGVLAASINVAAPLTGRYTVVVADWIGNREGSHVGDYLLYLVRGRGPYTTPEGDQGGPMTNGGSYSGRIGAPGANPALGRGDLDVWTFEANQHDAIGISVGEVLDSEIDPNFQPWIRLLGPDGVYITQAAGVLAASINVAAPLTGTYTVVVADWIGNREGSHVGDYVLYLAKGSGPVTTPPGDEGGPLTNGGNHRGRIGAPGAKPRLGLGDLDVWTFEAAQNDGIALSIGEVLDTEIDPDFQPWIRLIGPNGVYITQAAGVLAASINLQAPLTGTYTVVVGDWIGNREGSHVNDYVLHLVKTPGPYTIPAGDDGGVLANNSTQSGRIGAPGANPRLQRGDLDPWTFCAVQGAALTINVSEVVGAPPDPDFQPWIRLFRPDGTFLTQAAGTLNTSINVNAPVSGRYTLIVADWIGNREGSHVGDYLLTGFGITPCAVPPTTTDDAYGTPMNTTLTVPAPGVLGNDNSNGGGPLTAQLVSTVSTGTLALDPNGSFIFTPATGFTGPVSFAYRAVSSAGPGNAATVTITVTAPNVPTTANDSYSTPGATPLNVTAPGVLANDNSNGGGALSAQLVSTTANGFLSLGADGSFSYTPNPGFANAADSFTYRAVNGAGPGNSATVTINVGAIPTGPQPPTGLYASSIVGNTVTLRFTPPAGGSTPTGYVLEGGTLPGQISASLDTGSIYPIFTVVAPSGSFYVRMHTMAGGVKSAASNEIRIHVNVPVTPSAPANLTGLVNGSSIALAWRNTFEGGTPGGVILDVTGSLNASLPLGLTDGFQFNGVPGGTYTLSLRAANAGGSSPPSNPVTLTFPSPCSGPPLPPARFLAYRLFRTLFVIWDPADSGAAPTSFVVNASGAFIGSIGTAGRALNGSVGPGTYQLSVAAVNACGASVATPAQTVVVP